MLTVICNRLYEISHWMIWTKYHLYSLGLSAVKPDLNLHFLHALIWRWLIWLSTVPRPCYARPCRPKLVFEEFHKLSSIDGTVCCSLKTKFLLSRQFIWNNNWFNVTLNISLKRKHHIFLDKVYNFQNWKHIQFQF